jgi:hypothetical protein
MIEVESSGLRGQEMHVDGGVTSQVFMYPAGLDWKKVTDRLKVPGRPKLFLIRNSRTDPEFKAVERRVLPIMLRSVSSLIRTQGIGDIATIYFLTRRDEVDIIWAKIKFREFSTSSNEKQKNERFFNNGDRFTLLSEGTKFC